MFGNHDTFIGPATWVGVLQLVPPLVEEMNPTSSTQVAAVQTEMQQRSVALRDPSLDAASRNAQIAALQQEATTRISKILGGQRGLDAYKQYGGQWLVNLAPRPPQPPKN